MAMFRNQNGKLAQVKETPFKKEKELQTITEKNLESVFGLEFVATEYNVQGLFIDTLAFDRENKTFVIIEYKRGGSFSVVDQGFSYLSLMLNNKADFILAYNEAKGESLRREDIDWSQARIFFIARSFTNHQRNAINFKNMPFELWEVVRYDNALLLYQQIQISDSAESLQQMKHIDNKTEQVSKEIKKYTEEDLFGSSGVNHDLYTVLKEEIFQMYPDITANPKKMYVGYRTSDNRRNIFNMQKTRSGILVHFMRSKPEDFDDPQSKLTLLNRSREYWGQDISVLPVKNEKDIRYALLMIQQAYDRFMKEFGG
jgi:predicted transport protein